MFLEVPLGTIVTQMVGSGHTFGAEILVAIEASNSAFTKVKLSRFRHFFAISHLNICVKLTWDKIHVTLAFWTFNQSSF